MPCGLRLGFNIWLVQWSSFISLTAAAPQGTPPGRRALVYGPLLALLSLFSFPLRGKGIHGHNFNFKFYYVARYPPLLQQCVVKIFLLCVYYFWKIKRDLSLKTFLFYCVRSALLRYVYCLKGNIWRLDVLAYIFRQFYMKYKRANESWQ